MTPLKRPSEPKTSSNAGFPTIARPSTGQAQPGTASPIRSLFDSIAPDYDTFNAWASLGLHHRWRRALVRRIPADARVLDLATGTGDVAFQAADRGHDVVGLDFSERMLSRAREKDVQRRIRWVYGSADRLPFSDRSFGCVTSAFALRNLRAGLARIFLENYRVLKPGGCVLHMDFGRPQGPLVRWGHRVHLAYGIPAIGQWVCGDRWPRQYLERTIETFDAPQDVEAHLRAAGFEDVTHVPLLWGTVQIYEGRKSNAG